MIKRKPYLNIIIFLSRNLTINCYSKQISYCIIYYTNLFLLISVLLFIKRSMNVDYLNEIRLHIKERNLDNFKNILSKDDFNINAGYAGGRNILHVLIENNAPASFIQKTLSLPVEIDKKWIGGETPLHMAIKSKSDNSKEIVKLLLDNGANPNIIYQDKLESPLYMAVSSDEGVKGQYLLSHGASVNPVDNDKPFILMFLSKAVTDERYYLAIDHLIKTKSLDINYKDKNGKNIIDNVIHHHQKDNLLYLLKKENIELYNINEKGQDALISFVDSRKGRLTHIEAQEYNKSIIDILVDKKKISLENKDNDGKTVFDYIPNDHSYLNDYIKNKNNQASDYIIKRKKLGA